ncbi:MAG: Gfo/Idh/MocA family oxidoreductase [Bacteroidetes bacterium]|nr:Gfo/Idh/MocA family oxidoreductase [Bacteroidota bacterium]
MKKLKGAIFGCGFWSQFQIGGWSELPQVEIIATYNRTLSKAEEKAKMFNIPNFYNDAEQLLKSHPEIDFVDIITDVDTHFQFVELAARYKKNVICQKPMAPNLETAIKMVKVCQENNVKYYIHENYRWQPQFRRIKQILDQGTIGKPFRCLTGFNTAFPLFETQPFLAQLEQFALTDQGSHQFDVLRFFFGEAESLYCSTQQVNPTIKGEDVATTLIKMKSGVTCIQQISFSSMLEQEVFPQTLLLIEGSKGSIRLDPGLIIKTTTSAGTLTEKVSLENYRWQTERLTNEPPSIVSCNRDILNDMLGLSNAETTGNDNLKTVELVFAGYDSAKINQVIKFI